MSEQNGKYKYKYHLNENMNKEEYFYRFESILIPVILTFLIVIMAFLYRKFSSKNKNKNSENNEYYKNSNNKKNDSIKKDIKDEINFTKEECQDAKNNINEPELKEDKMEILIEENNCEKAKDCIIDVKNILKNKNTNKSIINLAEDKPTSENNDLKNKINLKNKKRVLKSKKSDIEILKSVIKTKFFMDFFKSLNKLKGYTEEEIENILNDRNNADKKDKKEKEIYFLLDDYKTIQKYQIINDENFNDNDILITVLENDNIEKENLYNKKDIINEFGIICINYNGKDINLLIPKQKYNKKITEHEILKEIMDSWCIKNIYKIFKLNSEYKIGISWNNNEKKYNVYLVNNFITTKNKVPKNEENKETPKEQDKNENITNNSNITPDNNINIISTKSTEENKDIQNDNINQNIIIDNTNNKSNTNYNSINNYDNINNSNNQSNNNLNNNENNNNVNYNNNNNNTNSNIINYNYIFPLVGLNNVGSTCFMNATLQCLLHISELNSYFIDEYPKDYQTLNTKNISSDSKGNISMAYFYVVQGVYTKANEYSNNTYMNKSFAPREFKQTLGNYNSQFQFYEANDSKDLILYLLQTFHEELNYFGDQPFPTKINRPFQEDRVNTFNYFMTTYNIQNFSIISKLFYGTYENMIKCANCKKIYFSYQKFEFISFSTYNYRGGVFNIMDGFRDNESIQYLKGDNQYFCSNCQKLHDAETCCKIIQPPSKLILNIDYGKNKVNQVKRLLFDEVIDITQYVNFNFGRNIRYQISGVCTHLGSSGPTGHYIAYCRNRMTGLWYNFNDSYVRQCNGSEIYNGSPYLLFYEQI